MKIFTFQLFCLLVCLSETWSLPLGEDERIKEGTVPSDYLDASYPLASCSPEKSIAELKALSNSICGETDSINTSVDYWVALCSCTIDKSLPCPHCSVSVDVTANGGRTTETGDHPTVPPTSSRSTTHWPGSLQLIEQTHNHGVIPSNTKLLLSLPQKRGGNHTYSTNSNNFIRFG